MEFKGLYYFAHPYTGDETQNFKRCCERSAVLYRLGYNLFSPISHSHPVHCATPSRLVRSQQFWYAADLHLIERVQWDGIILAPGWEQSQGCRNEAAWFVQHGFTLLYYDELVNTQKEYERTQNGTTA